MKKSLVPEFDVCPGFGVEWDVHAKECKICEIVYSMYHRKCKEVKEKMAVWKCRKKAFGSFVEGDSDCTECSQTSPEMFVLCKKVAKKHEEVNSMNEDVKQVVTEVKVVEESQDAGVKETLSSVIDELMLRGATVQEIIAELDKKFPNRNSMKRRSQIIARGRDRAKSGKYEFLYEGDKCLLIKK